MVRVPPAGFLPDPVLSGEELIAYAFRVLSWTVFFQTVYHGSRYVLPILLPGYRKLSKGDSIEFRMKTAAIINAFVSTQAAARILFFEDNQCWEEIYLGVSPLVLFYGEFTFGYLIHDFFSNVYHYRRLRKFTVLVHHFIGFFVMSSLSVYNYGHLVFASAYIVEISDGLSHITWMLSQFDQRHSFVYLMVLVIQYVSFIATRFMFNVYPVFFTWRAGFFDIVNVPMLMLTVPWSIFYLLNFYWFKHYHKILRLTLRNHWIGDAPDSPSSTPRSSAKRRKARKDPDPYTPGFTGSIPSSDSLDAMDQPPTPHKKKD